MIAVHILFTIIGLGCIIRGFVIPEFIEDVPESVEDLVESIKEEAYEEIDDETDEEEIDEEIDDETDEDKVAKIIAEICYWIVRVIWIIMWLVSGLSIIVLSWFGYKLSSLWWVILGVGILNPILRMCCVIVFWGLLHLLSGRY